MFDFGFWEIALVFVILLLVVGPERLPGLVRTIGLYVGKARAMVNSVKAEVERELQVDELKRSLQKNLPREEIERLGKDMRTIGSDLNKPATPAAGSGSAAGTAPSRASSTTGKSIPSPRAPAADGNGSEAGASSDPDPAVPASDTANAGGGAASADTDRVK